eukprot:TRINITY_DN4768_c0_g1_i1.p1 TRINITY_DN4768_c0_g1~~TRINITY_DN4768_c0_g1_i1.p1  ORF type:complete len:126 (+),score=18.22 TRINITY_DN4768_c0_g1_i1:56-433(+)
MDDSIVLRVTLNGINNCKINITDVVQVYLVDPPMINMDISMPILVRYWKRLIGFQKITLQPSKNTQISIDVRFDQSRSRYFFLFLSSLLSLFLSFSFFFSSFYSSPLYSALILAARLRLPRHYRG